MTDQKPELDAALSSIREAWDDMTAGIRRAWKAGMPSLAALADQPDRATGKLTTGEARAEMLRLGELLRTACDRADEAEFEQRRLSAERDAAQRRALAAEDVERRVRAEIDRYRTKERQALLSREAVALDDAHHMMADTYRGVIRDFTLAVDHKPEGTTT